MPLYRVEIDRKVTNWHRFTRFIEAPDEGKAEEIGQKLADEANRGACPDDINTGLFDDELDDWEVNETEEATEEELANATTEEMYEPEPCECCGDSGIEQVDIGHGALNEVPCSLCKKEAQRD